MDYRDHILQNDKINLHFWFAARLNLIDLLLRKVMTNKSTTKSILDIGCGTGTELSVLKKYGRVTALDFDQATLDLIKQQGIQTILADIEKFSLPQNNYDAVCCFDLLEHLTDDQKVLNNIFHSLKNNGYLIFTVPAWQFLYSTHDLALQHCRRYSQRELRKKTAAAGFNIIMVGYWNSILFPLEAMVRLFNKFNKSSAKGACPLMQRHGRRGSASGGNKKTVYQPDSKPLHPLVNQLLFSILNLENTLINYGIKFPFGLTIYGIAQKNVN